MDSQFINYDGRSVHDMIELLLSASGDPEAVRRLQEAIQAVDAKFTPVNTELARLEDDKQDVGNYITSTFEAGTAINKMSGSGIRAQFMATDGTKHIAINFQPETKSISLNWKLFEDTVWNSSIITADEDTGWQTLQNDGVDVTGALYRKINGIVYLNISNVSINDPTSWTTIGTLPTGFRPSFQTLFTIYGNPYSTMLLMVLATGVIQVAKPRSESTTVDRIYGQVSFPI